MNSCESQVVTHTNFANVVYMVGANSQTISYQPAFSGADNAVCPQTTVLSLKLDGQGDNWVNWTGGTFTIGATSYNFITAFTSTGAIGVLG